jgi:hypothetical protein
MLLTQGIKLHYMVLLSLLFGRGCVQEYYVTCRPVLLELSRICFRTQGYSVFSLQFHISGSLLMEGFLYYPYLFHSFFFLLWANYAENSTEVLTRDSLPLSSQRSFEVAVVPFLFPGHGYQLGFLILFLRLGDYCLLKNC